MAVPDKLPYTRGEKVGEILCGVLAAGFVSADIPMA